MAIQGLAYIPGAVLGGIQAISSYQKLKELQKQSLPTYNLQPAQQNVQMYEQRFRQGLSPEERAAMQQQFSSQQAGMYRAASDQSRGQLSSFLGRVSAFDRIKQATQLGSMMASERRAAMSGLAGARQGLESQMNRQTSMDYSRRMAEEQALGGALKAGTENLGNALTMGLYTGLTDQSVLDTGLYGQNGVEDGSQTALSQESTGSVPLTGDYKYSSSKLTPSIDNMGMGINDPLYIKPSRFKTPNLSFR